MLAQIGRSLEEPGLLKKTEKRLSCNLNRKGPAGTVQDNVLRLAAEALITEISARASVTAARHGRTEVRIPDFRNGTEYVMKSVLDPTPPSRPEPRPDFQRHA